MSATEKFIIYAPRYADDSGGSIVLHKLCDVLNKQGFASKLWPFGKPRLSAHAPVRSSASSLAYIGSQLYRKPFRTNKNYNTPIAKIEILMLSIVVYPEIVSGNPLSAKRYVRWFLHKPGFHKGNFEYKKRDLCFSYQGAFNSTGNVITYGGILTIYEAFLTTYRLVNFGPRTKTCYMIRKGERRNDLPDLSQQWIVDGRTHEELVKIFNECKACYFYDLYTAYATYAAVCGCIPLDYSARRRHKGSVDARRG